MSDEPFRFAIPPNEKNARKLVTILVEHGALTSEGLRQRFEEKFSLRNASYYNALKYCKKRGWFTGGGYGQPYSLSRNGAWKEPDIVSIGESAGVSRDRGELEYLANSQAVQIEGLKDEVERLRDWSNGSDVNETGVAIPSLIRIIADSASTMRQRTKAAGTILSYRVKDAGVIEFTRRFLQSICTSSDVATDHKLEASELLRRHEAPKIGSEIVRPTYRTEAAGSEAQRIEAWRSHLVSERKWKLVRETRNIPHWSEWAADLYADDFVPPQSGWPPQAAPDAIARHVERPGRMRRARVASNGNGNGPDSGNASEA